MIDTLARPIVDLIAAFGSGTAATASPADTLRATADVLDAVHALARPAISELDRSWTGTAADAAVGKAQATQVATAALSGRGREIAAVVDAAAETVRAGTAELQAILDSFLSTASAALPALTTPAGPTVLIAAAIDHLARALAVVERVRGDLAAHTARMTELTAPDPVPTEARTVAAAARTVSAVTASYPTAPALYGGPSASAASFDAGSSSAGFGGAGFGSAVLATGSAGIPSSYDPRCGGSGVEIVLPDGSTAVAPTPEAADAVRHALTQQGVPYQWGGTTPGQGLDCSGLTQWAYGEAGVDLPRLAQEQNVGVPVSPENLMPGDLAVWDGHVAMVIGNGQMIEAGDPISVSSIRTTNSGMGFHGFFRPTA